MNKRNLLISLLIAAIAGLLIYGFFMQRSKPIIYENTQYGFRFALPFTWENYSLVTDTWTGTVSGPEGEIAIEHGPLISLRNPTWTAQNPYQDIPLMIFTVAQWNALGRDQFHIGAAPINPSELGRNSRYVFALPARYNYAFPRGWKEVEQILESHPLKPF